MEVDFSVAAKKILDTLPKEAENESTLAEKVSKVLEAKAAAFNEKNDSEISVDQLKTVFYRGQAVTDWVYSPHKSKMQWAFARVNQFIYMNEGKRVSKSYKRADRDIAEGELEYDIEDEGKGYHDYRELDFAVARLDIKKAGIPETLSNQKIKDIGGLVFKENLDED